MSLKAFFYNYYNKCNHHNKTEVMGLVEYSDSESSDTPQPDQIHSEKYASPGIKRKHASTLHYSLPPLPDSFHDLYASIARVSNKDDPTLHAGRQRVTPHIEGNWPTHVYVECKSIELPSMALFSLGALAHAVEGFLQQNIRTVSAIF